MWLMTTFGAFSIVRKKSEIRLTVRSRVRKDLVRLRSCMPELSPISDNAGSDYPFRCTIDPAAFGQGLVLKQAKIPRPYGSQVAGC
jgi:hypothetical protein